MKKILTNNKYIIIILFIVLLLSIGVIVYIYRQNTKFVFNLIGKSNYTITVYSEYVDEGVIARVGKKNLTQLVSVDNSLLDNSKLGTYKITYTLNYENKEYTLERIINVVDDEGPTINLIGNDEIVVKVGSDFNDPGYTVVDNYDENIDKKVDILDNVNTSIEGIYLVNYIAVDSSNNTTAVTRKVIVTNNKDKSITEVMDDNLLTYMSYIDNGIYINGYKKENNGTFTIKLCNEKTKVCKEHKMNMIDNYYYGGNIDLSSYSNGSYYMYIDSIDSEMVKTKLQMQYRLARTKINNKLVTFNYENNNIKITIDDFEYLYDIVIDPGHGGYDSGATNSSITEKELNLMVSNYEKTRYLEHGLKVLMLRDSNNNYGTVLGDNSWPMVRQKAYALGYYGVVSRVTYSNHHNSNDNKNFTGWEIIIPARANKDTLDITSLVKTAWNNVYKPKEDHLRVYSRNYYTYDSLTKDNNEFYYFTDYYAVIRLPYQLFNVYNILYESSYLSNGSDFNWYYKQGNWKKVSEEKIKAYVTYLGLDYIEPKSN